MSSTKTPGKQIALTGATGFVGGQIMKAALNQGHKVKALTRRPVPEIKNVEWIKGDLDSKSALKTLLEDCDAFIHTAGLVKARSDQDFERVNSKAVEALVEIAKGSKTAGNFHFVLISSLAARHPHLSPYAKSKRGGEDILKEKGQSFPWTVIRPPAVYGPGDKEILKLFKAMNRGFAPAAGEKENVFSLIHVEDLSKAALACVHHQTAFSQTLEPDDGKSGGYTMKEVADVAEAVFGKDIKTLEIPGSFLTALATLNSWISKFSSEPAILSPGKVREMTFPNWVSESGTIQNIPHWKPEFPLDKGLTQTLTWYRDHGLL